MSLANALVVLNFLDGLVGVDHDFHIVWSRFRMMRRNLVYNPDEEPRIFGCWILSLPVLRVMVPVIF